MSEKKLKIVLSVLNNENIEWFADLFRYGFLKLVDSSAGSKIVTHVPMRTTPFTDYEEAVATLRLNAKNFYVCRDPLGQIPKEACLNDQSIAISVRRDTFAPGSGKETFDYSLLMVLFMHALSSFYEDGEEAAKDTFYPTINFDESCSRLPAMLENNLIEKMVQYMRDGDFEFVIHIEKAVSI